MIQNTLLIPEAINTGAKNAANAISKTILMMVTPMIQIIKFTRSMIPAVLCIEVQRIKEPGASKKLKVKNIISVSESFVP